jgi:class 3 adenylate cyclase
VICASCNHENRAEAKFCEECAAPLKRICASCGAELRPTAKFCDECGLPTASRAKAAGPRPKAESQTSSAGTRKIVSIIFADLMGSTALQERLDPESVNRVMDAYYQAVRGPVEAAGGSVVQLLGDGVLCAFGIPQIAQDDALRAVRAAVGIQQAFREFLHGQQWLSVSIGLRVAVNTGEVVVSDEHPAGIGDPLNVAARLQQEARDGEVLIGQSTRRLVADTVTLEQAGVFALKGRAETVKAYRVVSLERPAGAAAVAFVGRDSELARINSAYEAAVAKSAAHLAVLLGSPGLGKSRLIDEVTHRLGDGATVIAAQCDAAGGATFAPVAEGLRKWLGAERGDQTDPSDPTDPSDSGAALEAVIPESPERARIISGISALLTGSPASPEETFFVVRRFLAALAATKPVILVLDDLHWAEPLLLDLVEHLVQWGSGLPLLILVGARPELRERRSSLTTAGGFVATSSLSADSTPAPQCAWLPTSSALPTCRRQLRPRCSLRPKATHSSSASWCACWSTRGPSRSRASAGSSVPTWLPSRCRRPFMRCCRHVLNGCVRRSAACWSAPRWWAVTSRVAPSPRF